jgi:3-phenylpropionate/trans-cinnamate dioxygenase ferredoxin reductase subunit
MENTADRVVIIGGGHASAQLADSLRLEGHTGEIVLIGEEKQKPYQRPPLSKKFLSGEVTEERLLVRPEMFFDKASVTLRLDTRVEAIDRGAKQLRLADGSTLGYGKLAIVTGTRVRRIPAPGADLKGVCYLRGIDDVELIRGGLDAVQRVAIVGAGFIGLETAAVLRAMGKEVVVLEMQDRVMPRVVAPVVSEFYQKKHEANGVDVRTGVTVSGFEGENGRLTGVRLGDGSLLPVELAIVGIGVIPNTELAQAAGLTCDNGIAVDEFAVTSDPDIVAAGDVASHPNPFYGRRIRLESVHNAVEQAKTAAASLCGKPKAYGQYPWFWSDQYDLKLQMVGLSQGYDRTVVRGDIDSAAFSVFYFEGEKLLAVDSVNKPADHMQARRILNAGLNVTPAQAADTNFELKSIVAAS